VLEQTEQRGHSHSADAAASHAARLGARTVLLLPIDVPLVTPARSQVWPEARAVDSKSAPSDPRQGEALFHSKRCVNCHMTGTQQAGRVDLLERRANWGSMVETAAVMWNHAPDM
jgi:mono/diheme cytochrome c family protein